MLNDFIHYFFQYIQCITHNVYRAVTSLVSAWYVKLPIAGLCLLLQHHLKLISIFSLLVILDLVTKFISLSYGYMVTRQAEDTDFFNACRYTNLIEARKAGIIKSRIMKTQFVGKILTYVFVVATCLIVDKMVRESGGVGGFTTLAIGYLAMTELLSIVENLSESGVSSMQGLYDLIKKRKGN